MVYDLRMLKAIAPINMVNYTPFLLRFVPIYSSKFCVVSASGQFTLMDTSGPLNPPFPHSIELPPGASVTALDVSNSSQAIAFGDSSGLIHLFGASSEVLFNVNSRPTEFADDVSIIFLTIN